MPTPSRRQLRSAMRRAVGFSGSPTRKRSSPLSASTAICDPSGDHSAAPAWPANSASARGSPPASGRSQGCALPERAEMKTSVVPSGENRGRMSAVAGRDLLRRPAAHRHPPEPRPVLAALDRAPPVDDRRPVRRDRELRQERLSKHVLRSESPRAIGQSWTSRFSGAWLRARMQWNSASRTGRWQEGAQPRDGGGARLRRAGADAGQGSEMDSVRNRRYSAGRPEPL